MTGDDDDAEDDADDADDDDDDEKSESGSATSGSSFVIDEEVKKLNFDMQMETSRLQVIAVDL